VGRGGRRGGSCCGFPNQWSRIPGRTRLGRVHSSAIERRGEAALAGIDDRCRGSSPRGALIPRGSLSTISRHRLAPAAPREEIMGDSWGVHILSRSEPVVNWLDDQDDFLDLFGSLRARRSLLAYCATNEE